MTIRDAINEILAGLELGADPAEVLADHGFENISPEAFSTALTHFAELSPMETADALAPIVTRVSPVPFEAGDLPDAPDADAILAEGGDVFSLLSEVGIDGELADIEADALDDAVDEAVGTVVDASDVAADSVAEVADLDESTFGVGGDESTEDAAPDFDAEAELGDIDPEALVDQAAEQAGELVDGFDTADFTDLFDRTAAEIDDLENTDPSDLDLE